MNVDVGITGVVAVEEFAWAAVELATRDTALLHAETTINSNATGTIIHILMCVLYIIELSLRRLSYFRFAKNSI